jgi:PAS domain S-box-containing protein
MKAKILDIIDFEKVNPLLEGFNKTTGFVTAILDLEGNVLSKSGWRQICTEFHRINPETSKKCTISDTELAGKMAEGEKYHFYKCLNGLVDVAVPLIINGEHIANLFSGQFFFEEPELLFFTKQAQKYGFNEEEYIEALCKVPIVSKEQVLVAMDFLLSMTQLISEMTFQKLEQQELNKELKESEELFSLFMKYSPVYTFIKEVSPTESRVMISSDNFVDMTGIPGSEMKGKTMEELFPAEFAAKITRDDFAVVTKGEILQIDEELNNRSYTTIKFPIIRNGKTLLAGFTIDITERKQAEQKVLESQASLNKALEASNQSRKTLLSVLEDQRMTEKEIKKLNIELEQRVTERTSQLLAANKELEAFSYSVSHDLRAPLRAIHSFTGILKEDYKDTLDDEGRRICGIIEKSSVHMGQLIDDLLSFSRIGRYELRITKIDMTKAVKTVFSELSGEEEKKQISFKVEKLPAASGDSAAIKQVLINLISNAIKYTSKNDTPEIVVGFEKSCKPPAYYVKDNGVGFDMQYANKLFGVFQRLHSSKEFEGNGVGLAIVQRIIHRHGGKVWAEGEVGKGATFFFTLPNEDKRQK